MRCSNYSFIDPSLAGWCWTNMSPSSASLSPLGGQNGSSKAALLCLALPPPPRVREEADISGGVLWQVSRAVSFCVIIAEDRGVNTLGGGIQASMAGVWEVHTNKGGRRRAERRDGREGSCLAPSGFTSLWRIRTFRPPQIGPPPPELARSPSFMSTPSPAVMSIRIVF